MKPARVPQTVVAPDCWGDLPWGELYRKALERQLNPWFTKMYGFHLLKIGNLSAEINCEACAVSHQVNVSAQGMPVQVQADPLHLPFADKSVDVCLTSVAGGSVSEVAAGLNPLSASRVSSSLNSSSVIIHAPLGLYAVSVPRARVHTPQSARPTVSIHRLCG